LKIAVASVLAVTICFGIAPSRAQQSALPDSPPTVCFYAGIAFSPGIDVSVGGRVVRCEISDGIPAWVKSDATVPANCLRGGKLDAVGAIEGGGSSDDKVICLDDGTWK
jgi:hypothetical protein